MKTFGAVNNGKVEPSKNWKIVYFNLTNTGKVVKFERVLFAPYSWVWQNAQTTVYQYANHFSIEPYTQFRYKFLFADGIMCSTVASSCSEAESHFKNPLRLLSIDRLENITL